MAEGFYIFTVAYFIYVVEVVAGEEIADFLNKTFKTDLNRFHQKYKKFRLGASAFARNGLTPK